jgi:hypothetical protein
MVVAKRPSLMQFIDVTQSFIKEGFWRAVKLLDQRRGKMSS